jgi:hypothetical protein
MRSRGAGGPRAWLLWHGDIRAARVNDVRFGPREDPIYARLRNLVRRKDTFVLTSNVETMLRLRQPSVARVYFALRRLANTRNAPGTPAGNCRNQAYDVNTYTPLPYRVHSTPPSRGGSPGSFEDSTVS